MTDIRLLRFIKSVGHHTMLSPHGSDDDESIKHFIWLLDVDAEKLCEVQDEAIGLALDIYDPDPIPFIVGVADPDKSRFLRDESPAFGAPSTATVTAGISGGLGQPSATGTQVQPRSFVLGSRHVPRAQTNSISGPQVPSTNGLAYAH